MVAKYSVDVLRHWACKCPQSEAEAFRETLVHSGLELPRSEPAYAWAVIEGEEPVAQVNVETWQHVIGLCVKAERDGVAGRNADKLAAVLDDLSAVVNVFNVRESVEWSELVDVLEPDLQVVAASFDDIESVSLEPTVEVTKEVEQPAAVEPVEEVETTSEVSGE